MKRERERPGYETCVEEVASKQELSVNAKHTSVLSIAKRHLQIEL